MTKPALLDCESAYLAGMVELLTDYPAKARESVKLVSVDAFATMEHRMLFAAIVATLSEHECPQLQDLVNAIRENSRDVKHGDHAPEFVLMVELTDHSSSQRKSFHLGIDRRAKEIVRDYKRRLSLAASNDLNAAITHGEEGGINEALAVVTNVLGDDQTERRAGPILTCLADVEPRTVDWLWPGRIPLGRISLLVGKPGEGKSFLTTDMASRVSTGTPWPDGTDCPRGSVILISAEDDPGDTIRPRLDAHRADVSRIHLLSGVRSTGKQHERMISLADVATIQQSLEMHPDCKLIVVDPVGSFLGGGVDAHRDNEVRSVLAPIAKLAEQYGASVLVVAHRRKGNSGSADETCMGSRAFTGIARAVWHLSRDIEDKNRRLLLPGKNNLSHEGFGMAFSIIGNPARISWESDPVEMTADDQMASENQGREQKRGPDAEASRNAEFWLTSALAGGPRLAKELSDEWKNSNYGSEATLRRAKDAIGVESFRDVVPGCWYWRLPKNNLSPLAQGKQLEHLEHLANNTGNSSFPNGDNPKVFKLSYLERLGPSWESQWQRDSF